MAVCPACGASTSVGIPFGLPYSRNSMVRRSRRTVFGVAMAGLSSP